MWNNTIMGAGMREKELLPQIHSPMNQPRRRAMAKDLTVLLEDRPGTLADLGEALGAAGINIDGMCGVPCEGKGVIHILLKDAAGAQEALEGRGIEVSGEREVLVLNVEDKPGSLGEIARKIANAGVNIEYTYLATNTRLVIAADNLEAARAAL
jgi:hypothetical protein